ncbi:hypothetical protein [Paenibacillus sp. S25]|uniref:hypothetical protein n=1 Tax=Paenibacillus sp. S25 TaxID=2823905 RepID=UPI001C6518C7|nr:hypothetical protein [Paenibacillus sp. S25]QYK62607.1 hypothetical protein KAI37_02937 [Paenibacillus sp. S25]
MSKIQNETIYVIYRNGEPYQGNGENHVYKTRGAADIAMTLGIENEARSNYEKIRHSYDYKLAEWREIGHNRQCGFMDEIRPKFQVVEYGPKSGEEQQ